LVRCTGSFAETDFGSALSMVSVYMSENLGNLEETTKPVLVKEPCKKEEIKAKLEHTILIINVCLKLLPRE